MEKRMINLNEKNTQVVNGKVVIDSEELVRAIQSEEVKLTGEEENEGGFLCINIGERN